MNVKSVEKLEKSMVALTIEASAEELEAAVQKVYLRQRGKIDPWIPEGPRAQKDHRDHVWCDCILRRCCERGLSRPL